MTDEQKIADLRAFGYRVGKRAELVSDTTQPRLAGFAGEWAIDDPNDDEDGLALASDDLPRIVAEAHEERVQWARDNCPDAA